MWILNFKFPIQRAGLVSRRDGHDKTKTTVKTNTTPEYISQHSSSHQHEAHKVLGRTKKPTNYSQANKLLDD